MKTVFNSNQQNLWMLENKFCSMPANLLLRCEYDLNKIFWRRPHIIWKLFWTPFELINVNKKVWFNSYYFTSIPVAGWVGEKFNNKANSVQFKLKLPFWAELGNLDLHHSLVRQLISGVTLITTKSQTTNTTKFKNLFVLKCEKNQLTQNYLIFLIFFNFT